MMKVALIGAGMIGRSWAIVFARAGYETVLFDPREGTAEAALSAIESSLEDLDRFGLIDDPSAALRRIRVAPDPGRAVDGAVWVQESGPEVLDVKTELFRELDRLAPADAILASSSSGFPASSFSGALAGRARALVVHPVNPPHLTPLVEVAPAPWTDPETVQRALALMREVGQEPIHVRKEIDGFILNRLQGAVLNEAFLLVEGGHVSPDDLDRTMVHGLALRWSFMGPFETIDLNAPGGLRDYAERYGPMYHRLSASRPYPPEPWTNAAIASVDAQRRSVLPAEGLNERQAWRDRMLMRILADRRRAGFGVD